jgi:PAS domain S-box-containing protein
MSEADSMPDTMRALIRQNEELQARLDAAEEALRAIQSGEVDALVIYGEEGEQVYTLEGADRTYRMMIEKIQEGVATLEQDGMILYANQRLADMLGAPLESIVGGTLEPFLPPYDLLIFDGLLRKGFEGASKGELALRRSDGSSLPVLISMNCVDPEGDCRLCLVATDLTEQKRHEEILAAERLASSILDQIAEAVVVCDTRGTVIRASQGAFGLLGTNPLFQSFDLEFALKAKGAEGESFSLQAVMLGKTFRGVEVQLDRKPPRSLLLSATPLRTERGEILGCIVSLVDITRHKQAEEALRKSEEKFAQAFRSSPLAMTISTVAEGRFLEVNDSYTQLYGFTRDELIGHTTLELGIVSDPDQRKESIRTFRENGGFRNYVLKTRTKTGQERHTVFNTEPIEIDGADCILSTIEDITERRLAEQALQESEERFRQLADAMPQLVWTARPDGEVDYFNLRRQEYAGLTQLAGGAWDISHAIHPDDLDRSAAAWQQAIARKETFMIEMRMQGVEGDFRWHLSRAVLICDEPGNAIKWFGTATDIHDLKQSQARLEEMTRNLERSNQELEQFAFTASHDLQEPLRKITMFGNLLKERMAEALPAEETDYLNRMQNAARRMEDMIASLLELSRISTRGGTFELTPLAVLVEGAISDLETRIQMTHGKVSVGALPEAEVDPQQIRQLFQNLISNALKFHRPGTAPSVTISSACLSTASGPVLEISVEDNGIGFDEQYSDRIFQPFERLHGRSEYEGTGIGLTICRKIVERHHGRIEAHGMPGNGANFVIKLPVRRG